MFKVLLKLRKSWKSVVIVLVLLVAQAMAELALPDYTSRIVNVGIQQGGIESAIPEAIREEKLNEVLFATDKDEFILDNYELVSRNTVSEKEFDKYLKKYPALKDEPIYVLKEKISDENVEKLEQAIAKPLVVMYFMQNTENSNQIKEQMLSQMPSYQATYLKEKH